MTCDEKRMPSATLLRLGSAHSVVALIGLALVIVFGCGPEERLDRAGGPRAMLPGHESTTGDPDEADIRENTRIVNNDPFQRYPVWLPSINVAGALSQTLLWPDLAVDSRNISHVVYYRSLLSPGGVIDVVNLDGEGEGQGRPLDCCAGDADRGRASLGHKFRALPIGAIYKVLLINPHDKRRVKANLEVKQDTTDPACQLWQLTAEGDIATQNGDPKTGHWHFRGPHLRVGENAPQGYTRAVVTTGQGGGMLETTTCVEDGLIFYANDRYEARDATSFSNDFQMGVGFRPEIAVDIGDNIHVVWSVPGTESGSLMYRRYNRAQTQWETPKGLGPGDFPHIEVGPDNKPQILFLVPDLTGRFDVRYLKSNTAFEGDFPTASELVYATVNVVNVPIVDKPRLSIDGDGNPHAAWIDQDDDNPLDPATAPRVTYSKRESSGWTTPINVSDDGPDKTCDLAVFGSGGAVQIHLVWDETDTQGTFYRKRSGGMSGPIKRLDKNPQGEVVIPRVTANSRGEPQVLWADRGSPFGHGFAAKVKRPEDETNGDPTNRDKWGRQEPTEEIAPVFPDENMTEMVLNQNDNHYAVFGAAALFFTEGGGGGTTSSTTTQTNGGGGGGEVEPINGCLQLESGIHFSHVYEPNLGPQDPDGMVAWAPNTLANAVNGNVFLELPLFTSDGAGFAVDFAIIYNSLKWNKSALSPGWRHSYMMTLTEHLVPQPTVNVVFPDGRRVVYTKNPADPGAPYILREPFFADYSSVTKGGEAAFVLKTKFGIKYLFDGNGKLIEIRDTQPSVNTLRIEYDTEPDSPLTETQVDGLIPVRIIDSMNRTTILDYDSLDRLVKVTDPAGRDYVIRYEGGLKGKIDQVTFPQPQGSGPVQWKFEYWIGNNINPGEKHRLNLLSRIFTPRGSAETYHWELRYRQDNRAISATDPPEMHVVDDDDPAAEASEIQTKRHISYEDPVLPFETPNTVSPNVGPRNYTVTFEPEELGEEQQVIQITGNNAPSSTNRSERLKDTTMDIQYMRSLVDNVLGPDGHFDKRFFNTLLIGQPVTDATFRNLTVYVDRKGNAAKTEYETDANPAWVKDNVFKTYRPKPDTSNTEGASAPGLNFEDPITVVTKKDGLNRVETITDSRGNLTRNHYDMAGNLEQVDHPTTTDAEGNTQSASERFFYDGRGRVRSTLSARDAITNMECEDPVTGLVTCIHKAEHIRKERLEYHGIGTLKKRTLATGGVFDHEYDELDRLRKVTDPEPEGDRAESSFGYDLDSNRTSVTVPAFGGGTTTTDYVYDRLGRLKEIKQPTGLGGTDSATFAYDRDGNVRREKDFRGHTTARRLYDDLGRLKELHVNVGSTVNATDRYAIAKFQYDANANQTETRGVSDDGLKDRVIVRAYDARDLLKEIQNPDGSKDTLKYDANDNLEKTHREWGAEFQFGEDFEYDERDRVKSRFELTAANTRGVQWKYFHDEDGNLLRTKDPLGRGRRTTYTLRGMPEKEFAMRFDDRARNFVEVAQTEMLYDEDERLGAVLVVDPSGRGRSLELSRRIEYTKNGEQHEVFDEILNHRQLKNEFDKARNVIEVQNVFGVRTKMNYDHLGRLTEQIQDVGGLNLVTKYGWDANGKMTSVEFPPGQVTTYHYNKANVLEKVEYPPNPAFRRSDIWTFNEFGEVETHTNASGVVTTTDYDTSGRVKKEIYALATPVTVERVYTKAGELEEIRDGTTSIEYGYDQYQRMERVTFRHPGDNFGQRVLYTYYDNHLLRDISSEFWSRTTLDYDLDNLVDSVRHQEFPGLDDELSAVIEYDFGGRQKRAILGDRFQRRLYRDAAGRVTDTIIAQFPRRSAISSNAYQYDEINARRKTVYENLEVEAEYTIDRIQRLTKEVWSTCPTRTPPPCVPGRGNQSRRGSPVATVSPQQPFNVPGHYQLYKYDSAGNRKELDGSTRIAGYDYDPEHRLSFELRGVLQKVTATTASATNTHPGSSPERLNDGDRSDSVAMDKAWVTTDSPTLQHTATVSWSGLKPIRQIRVVAPTGPGGMQRFKVQVRSGGTFVNPVINAVVSAVETSPGSGWFRTTCHEVIFGIEERQADAVMFIQDVNGGSPQFPERAMLNELEAWEVVIDDQPADYEYDDEGRLKRRTHRDQTENFAYDYAGRLASYRRDVSAAVQEHLGYSYYPDGRRFSELDVPSGFSQRFAYDGSNVVTDFTRNPQSQQWEATDSYVYEGGQDARVKRFQRSGVLNEESQRRLYYVGDPVGTVNYVFDEDRRIVRNHQFATAWGEDIAFSQDPKTRDRHGFIGRERVGGSGLLQMGARPYDSSAGRFLAKEPVVMSRATQHYVYAMNNPVRMVDRNGLQASVERAAAYANSESTADPGEEVFKGVLRGALNVREALVTLGVAIVLVATEPANTYNAILGKAADLGRSAGAQGLWNAIGQWGATAYHEYQEDPEGFLSKAFAHIGVEAATFAIPAKVPGLGRLASLLRGTRLARILTTEIRSLRFLDRPISLRKAAGKSASKVSTSKQLIDPQLDTDTLINLLIEEPTAVAAATKWKAAGLSYNVWTRFQFLQKHTRAELRLLERRWGMKLIREFTPAQLEAIGKRVQSAFRGTRRVVHDEDAFIVASAWAKGEKFMTADQRLYRRARDLRIDAIYAGPNAAAVVKYVPRPVRVP